MEGLSQDQPRQHSDQGVSGDRRRRDAELQPAPRASARRASSRSAGARTASARCPNTDIVKGFEFEKGRYVVVDEEDIEKVRVDSTRVINLEKFTDDTAIDPIYLERPYYLAPDGPVAQARRSRSSARA